jgi:hypothetical protein
VSGGAEDRRQEFGSSEEERNTEVRIQEPEAPENDAGWSAQSVPATAGPILLRIRKRIFELFDSTDKGHWLLRISFETVLADG